MPVAAYCHKRVELLIESNPVKAINICLLIVWYFNSVTFECKVPIFTSVISLDVVVADSASALNWSNSIAFAVSKDWNRSCSILQRGLSHFKWIEIVLRKCLIQIPNMDKSILMSCHEEWKLATHVMHWHCNICLSNLLQHPRSLPSPELDSRIPSSSDNNWAIISWEYKTGHIFDWLLMLANYCNTIIWIGKVPFSDVVISTGQ